MSIDPAAIRVRHAAMQRHYDDGDEAEFTLAAVDALGDVPALLAELEAKPGCPKCGTILNAKAAGCDGPWHADNQHGLALVAVDDGGTLYAHLIAELNQPWEVWAPKSPGEVLGRIRLAALAAVKLHTPIAPEGVSWLECGGCDQDDVPANMPSWPCSTVQAIARELGLTPPSEDGAR